MNNQEQLADANDVDAPPHFAGGHHARLIDERVPFHIISRVFQGRHILRPDAELNDTIVGVVGRAQTLFPGVELYAIVFMSNHFHAIARGPAHELPFFIGYIKREISRRVGARPEVNWPGSMWHLCLLGPPSTWSSAKPTLQRWFATSAMKPACCVMRRESKSRA